MPRVSKVKKTADFKVRVGKMRSRLLSMERVLVRFLCTPTAGDVEKYARMAWEHTALTNFVDQYELKRSPRDGDLPIKKVRVKRQTKKKGT